MDVTLVPAGAGTVNVTVTGVAPDLNPEETRIEVTLASEEITKLPMAGHDVQQILALTPGVTGFEPTQPGGGYGSTLSANWAPPFQANGQGINGNLYLLDDLPVNNDVTQGAAIMFPNADMIDQVSMQTQTFSVENGINASLQTTFNTKSGANKVHGDLDYTYAGANLAAADNVDNVVNNPSSGVFVQAPHTARPYLIFIRTRFSVRSADRLSRTRHSSSSRSRSRIKVPAARSPPARTIGTPRL